MHYIEGMITYRRNKAGHLLLFSLNYLFYTLQCYNGMLCREFSGCKLIQHWIAWFERESVSEIRPTLFNRARAQERVIWTVALNSAVLNRVAHFGVY